MRAADYDDLPELRAILPQDRGYWWASDTRRARFLDEVLAIRSSAAMGYVHHAELHQREALQLLRLDMASRDDIGPSSG